jgi:ABC-type Zn uptake system ZnuABC Zn-binding protein ZnuA
MSWPMTEVTRTSRWAWLAPVLGAALVAAGCGSTGAPGAVASVQGGSVPDRVLSVVTTTTQVTDFVHNIGGTNVKIYAVLKANVDPHDYEPTPADLQAIADADLIVKNGVGLEKWFEGTITSADPRGPVVDASAGVTIRQGTGSDEKRNGDPHIWQNPLNAKIMVANIAAALEAADPAATATFEANLASYTAQLDALDADNARQIATLTNKKLVTNHDAFGYYVERYGLDFVGAVIPSFDTQAELSPADVNALVVKIRAQDVKAIFSESSLPPKTARAIAREAGVRVLAGGEALYGDTLGAPGTDGDTYLKMERHNTREIVTNLA